jgi:hypothetical protein
MTKRIKLTWALLVSCATSCLLVPAVSAQDPIRVESNQVLVPAMVFNKLLYAQLEEKASQGDLTAQDSLLWERVAVRNLVAKDFHLYEDGMEQSIQSVTLEPPALSIVRDNRGNHLELVGTGGGKWADPDQPRAALDNWTPLPQYVIAYIPPPSLEGSCHQIKVKMVRHSLAVWSRSEYCNTPHSAFDPLKGTEFGKQMEHDLASAEAAKIDLSVQAIPFYGHPGAARVYIKLEFPSKSLKHQIKDDNLYASIGALLMVYNKDGTLAVRLSDFACCDNNTGNKPPAKPQSSRGHSRQETSKIPNRYETQFNLPPGEYELRAILSDGEKFGRQVMPLIVDEYDGKQLAISEIALSRRIRKASSELREGSARILGGFLPLVSKDTEITPTTNTRFKKDEPLYVYFEVYEPELAAKSATAIEAHLRVVDANTGNVKMNLQTVNAAPYIQEGSPIIPIGRGINLKELTSGSYRLEVQASDSTGKHTAWRTADFSIE